MAKHTDGPWEVFTTGPQLHHVRPVGVEAEIATIWDPDKDVREANARLIAAAPDMLEIALEAYAVSVTTMGRRRGSEWTLLKAIAKARGQRWLENGG